MACIPLLFGSWFRACVENQPPARAQRDPTYLSLKADAAWKKLALRLVGDMQEQRARLRSQIVAAVEKLPRGTADVPGADDSEMSLEGTYGQLPEVVVDHDVGAIFPAPLGPPQRFSWFQVSGKAREALLAQDRFAEGFERWKRLSLGDRAKRFPELEQSWEGIDARAAELARQVRYLNTWIPQLARQWRQTERGSRPVQYLLTTAIQSGDARLMDALREVLKPTRVLKRDFLPEELGIGDVVEIPIATDIADGRFLAEVTGALDTYWNQSAWARGQAVRFRIRWSREPRDQAFARGKATLAQHLAKFPGDRASMTTGGLTTYVRGQTLVLGPGKINPRTLAHELGHLLGFDDCYLRTLSSQGAWGTAVLEWDNPLYPDDIMCDNTVGTVRAEVW